MLNIELATHNVFIHISKNEHSIVSSKRTVFDHCVLSGYIFEKVHQFSITILFQILECTSDTT